MSRQIVTTAGAPKAIGPYSQAVSAPAGRLLFCSGQIPLDPSSGEMVGAGDVRAQAERVLQNLGAGRTTTRVFANQFNPVVNVHTGIGRHALKYGFSYQWYQEIQFNPLRSGGYFLFKPTTTAPVLGSLPPQTVQLSLGGRSVSPLAFSFGGHR